MNILTFTNEKELSYAKREAYNTLRTNLSFCGAGIKVIEFTSSMPNEGKSTTVYELARSMAADNKKVIVLDVDLRNSVLASRYSIKSSDKNKKEILGMTHYLTAQASLDDVIYHNETDNFDVILAGRSTPSPTELINSELFDLVVKYCREVYDYVIIDAPPIGSVIDAAIIATRTDGIVYVVEQGITKKNQVLEGKRQLEESGVRILGVVLNKVNIEKGGKGYYKGYYKDYYSDHNHEK